MVMVVLFLESQWLHSYASIKQKRMSSRLFRLADEPICKNPRSVSNRLLCSESRILRALKFPSKLINLTLLNQTQMETLKHWRASPSWTFLTETLKIDLADVILRHEGVHFFVEIHSLRRSGTVQYKVSVFTC